MSAESRATSWARARPVLERLLVLPEEQRQEALLREPGLDDALREELRRLLAAGSARREIFEPLDGPEPRPEEGAHRHARRAGLAYGCEGVARPGLP